MLSKVLDKSTCAKCKICCEFEKGDEWEIPVINNTLKQQLDKQGVKTIEIDGCCKYDLEFEDSETKFCPFHNKDIGCVLDDENKPFDCKIWPIRVMKDNGNEVFAVAKLCPSFKESKQSLIELLKNGLKDEIEEYISKKPYIINDLEEDYEVLLEL